MRKLGLADMPKTLSDVVKRTNTAVYGLSCENAAYEGMGTTLEICVASQNTAYIAHIGDSRVYLISPDGNYRKITKDHSLVENMVDRGDITAEEARHHPNRNLITRALGPGADAKCDGYTCPMNQGDYLLLCTDGLVGTVTDQEMLFEVIHGGTVDSCLERLMEIAKSQGAPDNVTAVLMQKL
jgi:protein phosphatase